MLRDAEIDREILARDLAEKVVAVNGPSGTPHVSIGMQADFPGPNSSKTHGLSPVFETSCQCDPPPDIGRLSPTSQPSPQTRPPTVRH